MHSWLSKCCPVVCCLLFALPVQAERYLNDPKVTEGPLYTGTPECRNIGHRGAQEWQAGLTAEERPKSAMELQGFLVEDPAVNKTVNSIAERLVQAYPGKCPGINVFVVAQGSPVSYEAMTSSLGEIFVRYGVLAQAETEDEVAAVIAHELAHVYMGHVESLDIAREFTRFVEDSSSLREIHAAIDNTDYDDDKNRLETDEQEMAEEMRRISQQRKLAKRHYVALHASLFSRDAEYEADLFAVDLLAAAGYSPVAMTQVLQRIGEAYDSIEKLQKEAADRATDLLRDNAEYFISAEEDDPSMEEHAKESAKAAWKSFREEGESWLNDLIRSTHPKTEKRLEAVNTYMMDELTRAERKPPANPAVLQAQGGHVGKVVGNISAANDAYVALITGKVEEAEKLALQGISQPTSDNAYSRHVAFLVRSEQGKPDLAARNLQSVDDGEWFPVDATAEMASMLIVSNQLDQAKQLIREKETYAHDSSYLYPVKIILLQAYNKRDEGVALAHTCVDDMSVAGPIADDCSRIAGIPGRAKEDSAIDIIGGALKRLSFGGDK